MSFIYDQYGRGLLVTMCGDELIDRLRCRTGSISNNGTLVRPLPVDNYCLPEKSAATDEPGMWLDDPRYGRKIRLFRAHGNDWARTSYLIHPDGGKGGTGGCIGIEGSNARHFFSTIDRIIEEQHVIPLTVGSVA